jgi:hypothetical protein
MGMRRSEEDRIDRNQTATNDRKEEKGMRTCGEMGFLSAIGDGKRGGGGMT